MEYTVLTLYNLDQRMSSLTPAHCDPARSSIITVFFHLVWSPAQIGYGVRTLDPTKGLIHFAGLALAANAPGKATPLDNDENISARARETWVCVSECAAQFLAVI
mgnify:FL=1